jgi:hypothetical protein
MKKLLMLGLAMAFATGCAATPESDPSSGEQEVIAPRDPLALPQPMLAFLESQDWGSHHLEWYTVRQWERLGADDQAWAKRQGWSRADLMEGAKGNGLEFLAMHRVMIRILSERFPENAKLFVGWDKLPVDNDDKSDPATDAAAFDAAKATAIDKLQNHLADFASDDELGLYLETTLRPTANDPEARSTDRSAGIHNYLHYRFQDAKSAINIGDPSVNLQNQRFWRLHGWIEARWTEYRKLKGRSDQDPTYLAAIKKGETMLALKAKGPPGGTPRELPPESLRRFFAKDP